MEKTAVALAAKGLICDDRACKRCNQPLISHGITTLGALVCLDMPHNSGLAQWDQHGFMTLDGRPYLSLMEQVGHLAVLLEGRGLPDAYESAMERINRLMEHLAVMAKPRLEGDALPRLLKSPHPEVPLGVYRHYKGKDYLVVGGILMASGDSEEILIAYVPFMMTDYHYFCCRTLVDWRETVPVPLPGGDQGTVVRFTLLKLMSSAAVHDHLDAMLGLMTRSVGETNCSSDGVDTSASVSEEEV